MLHTIDFTLWSSFKKSAKITPNQHRTTIILDQPGTLRVHKGDQSYTIGFGTEFTVQGEFEYLTSTQPGTVNKRPDASFTSQEAPMTNINKLPQYSAETNAVTAALREMKKERKHMEKLARDISKQKLVDDGHEEPDPINELPPIPDDETPDTNEKAQ